MKDDYDDDLNLKNTFIVGGIIILLILLISSTVIVGPGKRGVLLTLGKVEDKVLNEGLHFKLPLVQYVKKMDTRILKTEVDVEAASKDLQETKSIIALNFHIDREKCNFIYQTIGSDYDTVVIQPAIQEITKASTAKFTAVELITQREKVKEEIRKNLSDRLSNYNITVVDFAIVNFGFSEQFTKAIEEKQTAEQNALKAKRDLDRIKVEANQIIVTAEAEAKSLKLKKEQITPTLLQLKWVEKWDGHLPQVQTGSAIPMINFKD